MPESCCFVRCRNRRCKGSGKRFFRVPADPVERQRWIAAINRKHWVPTVYTRVCSDHFNTGELPFCIVLLDVLFSFVIHMFLSICNLGAPSKEPCHPLTQDSGSALLTKQSFARLFRAQTRSKRSSLKMNVANMCNLKYPVLRIQKCDATKGIQSDMEMHHAARPVEIQASIPPIHSADLACSHPILHSENPLLIPVGSNVPDSIEDQLPADRSGISDNSNDSDTVGMEVLHTVCLEQQSHQILVQLNNITMSR